MRSTLPQQIERTAAQLRAAKPRSNLRLKLEIRLRELVTIQLKREIRQGKKAA